MTRCLYSLSVCKIIGFAYTYVNKMISINLAVKFSV